MASEIKGELRAAVEGLKKAGKTPGLATILVGQDEASKVYVASKIRACEELGIKSFHHLLPETSTAEEITALIRRLNVDAAVSGILLQLPLPKASATQTDRCLEAISPEKDVDGLHPYNIGQLCLAKAWSEIVERRILVSCTPLGVIELLHRNGIPIAGRRVVVVGRSNLFGKPAAQLFLANDATVTTAHSRTKDLAGVCRQAEILVAAIGKPKFITKDFVAPGAVVIDVGINRTPEGLVGDVDFDAVKDITSYITPVPGGVGATTITMLMKNTVIACERQNSPR